MGLIMKGGKMRKCESCEDEFNEEDLEHIEKLCFKCNGSGEGYTDGSRCTACKGSGVFDWGYYCDECMKDINV